MDEVNVVAGVDDEPGVNVQTNYVDSRSPLPDGLDEIVNANSPESLHVRIGGQTEDDILRESFD
jgi:hypothetical protein